GGRPRGRRAGGGPHRGRQRTGQVKRRVPVVGERGRVGFVVAAKGGGAVKRGAVRGVQPDALARQHVFVDRVPGQRVPEGIPGPARVDEEQVAVARLAQRAGQ